MQDIHIGVVLLRVVVLPRLVPPAKPDHRRPTSREQVFQRIPGPLACIDFPMMNIASEFHDHERFSGGPPVAARYLHFPFQQNRVPVVSVPHSTRMGELKALASFAHAFRSSSNLPARILARLKVFSARFCSGSERSIKRT